MAEALWRHHLLQQRFCVDTGTMRQYHMTEQYWSAMMTYVAGGDAVDSPAARFYYIDFDAPMLMSNAMMTYF